jgi:hemerythrin-like metal-binding protein
MFNAPTLLREDKISRAKTREERLTGDCRALDGQHRELFGLIHRYSTRVSAGADAGSLVRLLRLVLDSAQKHFLAEEALLSRLRGFSRARLLDHQAQHCGVIDQLAEIIESMANGSLEGVSDRKHALDALIVHHVRHDAESAQEWLLHA